MTRVVTAAYRYKLPPRKRTAVAIAGPAIVRKAARVLLIRDILDRMRHHGCGGRAGKAELLTGIEEASSRPVRKIVLLG